MILLILSYYFYMCWGIEYAFLLFISTILTYISSRCIEKQTFGHKKLWLVLGLVLNLGILAFFKYWKFILYPFTALFSVDTGVFHFILPVGISFYIFQSTGYMIDVYRKDMKAETNFITYALFVSFFPQISSGPIGRSKALLPQFKKTSCFSWQQFHSGLILVLWGLFQKLMIADRLSILVGNIYDAPSYTVARTSYLAATIAFAFQIYCDFSSYSNMARGSAKMFGIELMENFKAPYFATSIRDFWRRWHISLSSWFRDYLYIPLGGNRKGKLRGCIYLLIVFAISGLWHGAEFHFIVWGLLNGGYQVISTLLAAPRNLILQRLQLDKDMWILRIIQRFITFALVCATWIFFRAANTLHGIRILRSCIKAVLTLQIIPDISMLGVSTAYLLVVVTSIIIVLLVDWISIKKHTTWHMQVACNPWLRYAVYLMLIISMTVFGYYGAGYDPQEFIYFQF